MSGRAGNRIFERMPGAGAFDACVWGYPTVLFDAAARRSAHFDGAELDGIALPNSDMVFESSWLDVRRGPVALTIDETTHYQCVALVDARGRAFASLGTRTTGNQRQSYAIVPPRWNGTDPSGMRRIEAPTTSLVAIGQSPRRAGVHAAGALLWTGPIGPRAISERIESREHAKGSIADDIAAAGGAEFLRRLRTLLGNNESDVVWREAIDQALQGEAEAVERAFADALDAIETELPLTEPCDGWQSVRGADVWGGDVLLLAQSARFNFCSNDPNDVLCKFARSDGTGRALNGSDNYRLHFDAWNEPPARAFWSLMACDARFRALTNDPLAHSVRSRDGLIKNPDDSIDIMIQTERPARSDVNWLAVPNGEFTLILRLYWPRPPASTGVWAPPSVRRATGPD